VDFGSVCIVIVNYRTAGLAIDCLHSLAGQVSGLPGLDVLVVDNDSADGSVDRLRDAVSREGWANWVRVLPAGRNGGFAFGNNVGIREALGSGREFDYILLLNPDTIVRDGAIGALVEFMAGHPQVGIAGSLLEDGTGQVESSAHTAPSPLGELESSARLGMLSRFLHRYRVSPPIRDEDHECDWVSGACLMARRRVLEVLGGLDEGYFLYFEEVDLCTRARQAGWKVWFVPRSRIVHLEGASTGIREAAKRRPPYWYASRRRYFLKFFGVPGLVAADLLWAVGRFSLVLRRTFAGRRGELRSDPRMFALDLLWGDLRSLFAGGVLRIRRGRMLS
jgi:GT2 family glycosyltransferase